MKLKIPGKSNFEIRNQNFCYNQVIVFDLSYLPVAAVGTLPVRYHEKNVKNIKRLEKMVKNYNLNVTEFLVSDFKIAFPGIFNFTVGILNSD